MNITERTGRRITLSALLAIVIPMLLFPRQFGLQLASASLSYVLFELVYYGVVTYVFDRRATLLQLAQAAGLTFICRLLLGAAFGLLIAASYGMSLSVTMSFGLSSYLPCVLFHVAVAPFVIKPLVDQFLASGRKARRSVPTSATRPAPPSADRPDPIATDLNVQVSTARSAIAEQRPEPRPPMPDLPPVKPASRQPASEQSGFERAVRYIGEHGAVHLAIVVDVEGLMMGHFQRGDLVAEDWAPLSLLFLETNQHLLERNALGQVDRLDYRLEAKRIVTARCGDFVIMVVAERQSDDVLNIRIAQAVEIVSKYVAERYAAMSETNVEKTYVSST